MQGDQLSRQWWIIRAVGTNPNGLTVAEMANRDETETRVIFPDLEALQPTWFSLYIERVDRSNRWTFSDTLKFKIHISFPIAKPFLEIP